MEPILGRTSQIFQEMLLSRGGNLTCADGRRLRTGLDTVAVPPYRLRDDPAPRSVQALGLSIRDLQHVLGKRHGDSDNSRLPGHSVIYKITQ